MRADSRSGRAGGAAWTFYYDDACGMCVRAVALLRPFDRRGRVAWRAAREFDGRPPELTRDDLDRSAYLVAPSGETYEGFFAFRRLLMSLPLLRPLGALTWLPGARLVGVPVYRWIADNRHRLSGCAAPTRAVEGRGD